MPRAPVRMALPLGSLLLRLTTIIDLPSSVAGRSSSRDHPSAGKRGAGGIALLSRAQSSTVARVASQQSCAMAQNLLDLCVLLSSLASLQQNELLSGLEMILGGITK